MLLRNTAQNKTESHTELEQLLQQECPDLHLEEHFPAEFISNLLKHTCLEVSSNFEDANQLFLV